MRFFSNCMKTMLKLVQISRLGHSYYFVIVVIIFFCNLIFGLPINYFRMLMLLYKKTIQCNFSLGLSLYCLRMLILLCRKNIQCISFWGCLFIILGW